MSIGVVLLSQPWRLIFSLGALVALWWAWRVLEMAWISPRKLGRALRAQGLRGTVYRFPFGDLKEFARLVGVARSKPMPLSHDITPRVNPLYHNVIKEHGKISVTWFGPTPRVIVNDPKLVGEILTNKHGHFRKRKFTNGIVKRLANGLVSHEGEKWAAHRKIINPAFHVEKLKKMLPAFVACCNDLVTRWEDHVGSDETKEIDVWPEFQNLTGDVISRAAFGSSFSEGRRIFQIQSEQARNVVKMVNSLYLPGFRFIPMQLNRRMKANTIEVEALLAGIIGKREKAMKEGNASKNEDLLGMLMECNIAETKEAGTAKPIMTMDDIIGELKLFYFAGMDTTAVLLTWAMVALSMHPEWQDRAREEVQRVFGDSQPDFDGISQLKIVAMILYEVLRLYPPVVQFDRQTYEEVELGGVRYPPGVTLSLPIVFLHHDPDVWGEDADEFRPERFAEGISKASRNGSRAFFPFGWGPRICVGQNFAMVEAKMALSKILQRFSFGLSPAYMHAPFPVSTLQPDHGAQIMLKKL
ncbi:cytochrome P450 CYP72A616 [Lolium perenne]|uniref:cytochrome P450 CYP72A616 n=1 Tax=Lolium perenne TaxID=4522 RepID=UPI0021EA112C|nr:cytochrome P450 CYP72A616-like [Lolium perenne]